MQRTVILSSIAVLLFAQQQLISADHSVLADGRPQWTAGINKRFANIPSHQLIQELHLDATFEAPSPKTSRLKNLSELKVKANDDSFDASAQWPECADTFLNVRDQGACNGWASIVASVMTDLTCIVCEGQFKPYLSEQDILSCSNSGNCKSASLKNAFDYWYSTGVVTGGPYGSNSGCLPYYYPPRHGKPANNTPPPIPACTSTCQRGYPVGYKFDKHEGDHFLTIDAASEHLSNEPETMKMALSTYGPSIAIMSVYEDFVYNYTSGVYYHKFGNLLGNTPVKVIGYGMGSIPYWLAVNSWGPGWGMEGLFKIYRDGRECDFESNVLVAAGAALSSCFTYETSTSSSTSKKTTATTKTSTKSTSSSSTSKKPSSSTSSSSSSSGTSKRTSSSSTTKSTPNSAHRFLLEPIFALVTLVLAIVLGA